MRAALIDRRALWPWGTMADARASGQGLVTTGAGATALASTLIRHPGGVFRARLFLRGTPLPAGAPDAGRARVRYSLARAGGGEDVGAAGTAFPPDVWTDLIVSTPWVPAGDYRFRIAGAKDYMSDTLDIRVAMLS